MPNVPVIDPSGKKGTLPAEQLDAAIKAGYQQAVSVTDPSGRTGTIPSDQLNDALKSGYTANRPGGLDEAGEGVKNDMGPPQMQSPVVQEPSTRPTADVEGTEPAPQYNPSVNYEPGTNRPQLDETPAMTNSEIAAPWITAAESAAALPTFGGSSAILEGLGAAGPYNNPLSTYGRDAQQRKEDNPVFAAAGSLGSAASPLGAVLGAGGAATAKLAGGIAEHLGVSATSGLVSRLVQDAATRGLGSAAEVGLYTGSQVADEKVLGNPDLTAQKAMAQVLWGGGAGLLFGMGGAAVNQSIKKFLGDESLIDILENKGADWAQKQTGASPKFTTDTASRMNPGNLLEAKNDLREVFKKTIVPVPELGNEPIIGSGDTPAKIYEKTKTLEGLVGPQIGEMIDSLKYDPADIDVNGKPIDNRGDALQLFGAYKDDPNFGIDKLLSSSTAPAAGRKIMSMVEQDFKNIKEEAIAHIRAEATTRWNKKLPYAKDLQQALDDNLDDPTTGVDPRSLEVPYDLPTKNHYVAEIEKGDPSVIFDTRKLPNSVVDNLREMPINKEIADRAAELFNTPEDADKTNPFFAAQAKKADVINSLTDDLNLVKRQFESNGKAFTDKVVPLDDDKYLRLAGEDTKDQSVLTDKNGKTRPDPNGFAAIKRDLERIKTHTMGEVSSSALDDLTIANQQEIRRALGQYIIDISKIKKNTSDPRIHAKAAWEAINDLRSSLLGIYEPGKTIPGVNIDANDPTQPLWRMPGEGDGLGHPDGDVVRGRLLDSTRGPPNPFASDLAEDVNRTVRSGPLSEYDQAQKIHHELVGNAAKQLHNIQATFPVDSTGKFTREGVKKYIAKLAVDNTPHEATLYPYLQAADDLDNALQEAVSRHPNAPINHRYEPDVGDGIINRIKAMKDEASRTEWTAMSPPNLRTYFDSGGDGYATNIPVDLKRLHEMRKGVDTQIEDNARNTATWSGQYNRSLITYRRLISKAMDKIMDSPGTKLKVVNRLNDALDNRAAFLKSVADIHPLDQLKEITEDFDNELRNRKTMATPERVSGHWHDLADQYHTLKTAQDFSADSLTSGPKEDSSLQKLIRPLMAASVAGYATHDIAKSAAAAAAAAGATWTAEKLYPKLSRLLLQWTRSGATKFPEAYSNFVPALVDRAPPELGKGWEEYQKARLDHNDKKTKPGHYAAGGVVAQTEADESAPGAPEHSLADIQRVDALAALERANASASSKIKEGAAKVVKAHKSQKTPSNALHKDSAKPLESRIQGHMKHAEVIRSLANPDVMAEQLGDMTGSLDQHAPQTASAMQTTATRAQQFLQSKLPEASARSAIGPEWEPSAPEISKYNQYRHAVEKPLSILESATTGTLTPEAVEAVSTVYPDLYQEMQNELMNSAADHRDMPMRARMATNLLMGQDLSGEVTGSDLVAGQYAMGDQKPSAQGMPGGNHSLKDLNVASQWSTPQQKVVNGREAS